MKKIWKSDWIKANECALQYIADKHSKAIIQSNFRCKRKDLIKVINFS